MSAVRETENRDNWNAIIRSASSSSDNEEEGPDYDDKTCNHSRRLEVSPTGSLPFRTSCNEERKAT